MNVEKMLDDMRRHGPCAFTAHANVREGHAAVFCAKGCCVFFCGSVSDVFETTYEQGSRILMNEADLTKLTAAAQAHGWPVSVATDRLQ